MRNIHVFKKFVNATYFVVVPEKSWYIQAQNEKQNSLVKCHCFLCGLGKQLKVTVLTDRGRETGEAVLSI